MKAPGPDVILRRLRATCERQAKYLEPTSDAYEQAVDTLVVIDAHDKYREHSKILNRVGWRIATALGKIGVGNLTYQSPGAEEELAELLHLLDYLRAERDQARRKHIESLERIRAFGDLLDQEPKP